MFNQMKQNYRKRNVYTLEDTYKILDLQDNVTVVPVKGEELFKDCDEVFDEIYKRPKAGTIKKNHIFSYSEDTIATVTLATKTSDHSSSMQTQQLIKLKNKWTPEERLEKMSDIDPIPLTRPGLSYMKQVHLYSKWRRLLPSHLQDVTCPKPSRLIIEQCKKDTKRKNDLKRAKMYPNNDDESQHSNENDLVQPNENSTSKTNRSRSKSVLTRKRLASRRDNSIIMDVQVPDDTELFTQPPPPTIAADVESLDSEENVRQARKKRHVRKKDVSVDDEHNETDEDDNDDRNDPDFVIDAGSATEVHDSDEDGSLLDDPFIFTEDSFIPKGSTTEERELEHKGRAKTLMARRLGKVEAKKQIKANKSSTNPKTSSPDKNDLDKDEDDSKLENRIKTIAARRRGKVSAMKEARVDRMSEGNPKNTPPVNVEPSINENGTSSSTNDDIDKRKSYDPKIIAKTKTVMERGRGKLEAMKQTRAEESVQKDIQQQKRKDRLKLSQKKKSDLPSPKPPSERRLRSDTPKRTLRNRQVKL